MRPDFPATLPRSRDNDPRDPPVLKLLQRANSVQVEIRYDGSKTLRRVLENACFPEEKERETVQMIKTTAVAKRSDSSAVVCLVRTGPSGKARHLHFQV